MIECMTKNATTFVCPVLFSVRKDLEVHCINKLWDSVKKNHDNKLFVAGHKDNTEFLNWNVTDPNIQKICYNTKYSISEPINMVAKQCDTEFFCFIHSDVEICNPEWIDAFRNLTNTLPQAGVLGIQQHSDVSEFVYTVCPGIHHVLFADAIMFFKSELFEEIGLFSTKCIGDCESEDFEYKAMRAGFKNYVIEPQYVGAIHHLTPYKLKMKDSSELIELSKKTKELSVAKWKDFRKEYVGFFKKVYNIK